MANAAMTSDSFCSAYCHGCNASVTPAATWQVPRDAEQCEQSMALIANMSANGQLTQSHTDMKAFEVRGPQLMLNLRH